MKLYPEGTVGTRDLREMEFNKNLSLLGVKVEDAFVVLKDRCRILPRSSSRHYCFITIIIIMTVILIHFYQCVRTVPSQIRQNNQCCL